MMIYDLPLVQPTGIYVSVDIEANKKTKDKIEGIPDLEKKLKYYNSNIRSLSIFSMDAKIYFRWCTPDQQIKVFCNCKNCRSLSDFNPEHEQIFFKLRAKEVQHLVNGINRLKNYKDKLAFLFNIKGYNPEHTLTVHANVPFDSNGNPDREMWLTEPVIDLTPTTKEERIIYNQFVRLAFNKKYKDGNGFSKAYNYFDFEKEKKRFESTLNNSVDPQQLVEYLINKIEKHFGYPESINAEYKETHITKKINQQLEEMGLINNCFTKMVLGVPIDLDEYKLDNYALMQYTYFSEVVKFYRYLKDILSQLMKGQLAQQGTPKAPVIALFCFLMNESGKLKKGITEPVPEYCQRVCEEFNLNYTDRVRQGFNTSGSRKNIEKVIQLILPNIDKATANTIIEHISNKNKPKTSEKLYA